MQDEDAVEGLTRLGLTTYEARVFVALQKLGSGTASDVSDVADVPRSQVYGAAEGLEERGLVETQKSTPTVYRPVGLEAARTRLLDQLAETGQETFEYLETVQGSASEREESEAIWLVQGRDAVVSRTVDLAEAAEDHLVYGIDSLDQFEDEIRTALRDIADEGIEVVVASADADVRASVEEPMQAYRVPDERSPKVGVGRVLLVDRRTILLSVFSTAASGEGRQEVAFLSENSTFAAVLVDFMEEWLAFEER